VTFATFRKENRMTWKLSRVAALVAIVSAMSMGSLSAADAPKETEKDVKPQAGVPQTPVRRASALEARRRLSRRSPGLGT
jgi:hypothetical protein